MPPARLVSAKELLHFSAMWPERQRDTDQLSRLDGTTSSQTVGVRREGERGGQRCRGRASHMGAADGR